MRATGMLAGVLTSVGLAAAGLGMVAGTAAALPSGQHTWCPGQAMDTPAGPGRNYVWDMNVCHTWQYVKGGMGNVAMTAATGYDPVTFQPTGWTVKLEGSNVWDGPTPPPDSLIECGYDLFGIPIRC